MTASALGNVNAVNANPMAMSKASLNSIVGQLGALAVDNNISLESLAALSNKISGPVENLSEDEEAALNEAKETLEAKADQISRSDPEPGTEATDDDDGDTDE
jgi:hypothetical protein